MDLNLEIRSEILSYSLIIENSINDLLLLNLGIKDDRKKTRLFGSKASISFKNKIDLLYDINVLNREENFDFELLMIFRNKFLHDINCNSFKSITEQFDNGLKNKFKLFYNEKESFFDELASKNACSNLFKKNILTLKCKVKENRLKTGYRNELFQIQNKQILNYIDVIGDLMNDLYIVLEKSELEDEKVNKLSEGINLILDNTLLKLNSEDNTKIEIDNFFNSPEKMKHFFGITKSSQSSFPNWNDFKNRQD